MARRLEGAVAVVTGGGRGIGEATCRLFAEEGAHVVAVDVDGDAARRTAEEIEADGGPEATGVEADVADEAAVEAMARRVEERHGAVDVLVNNAGIRVEPGPVTEADAGDVEEIVGVNLKGAIHCSKHVVPLMTDGGSVVHVSSVGAEAPRAGWGLYDATKGALRSLARDMACDHAEDGIRVNAVSPGWAITDYHLGDRTGEEARRFVEEKTTPHEGGPGILERAAEPREIASAILFLASEESSYVTGANLAVDGGGL